MNTIGLHKIGDVFAKNSPTILTGVSVAGLVTTAILAVKATPKALLILEDEVARLDDEYTVELPVLSKKEIIKLTYKCYIPAVVVGGVAIACIIGSNTINLRRNAALSSVYALTETAFKQYQAKVVETIGKEKAREIKDEVVKDKLRNNAIKDNEIIYTGNGETLCFDVMSGRYFKSDRETIREAINNMNVRLRSEMTISLNELYYSLDLDGTKMGDMLCWHIDSGNIDPRFSSQLTRDGKPCLVLDFDTEPEYMNI